MTEKIENEGWSWTLAPAIPCIDDSIKTLILAHDGEYPYSFVYHHDNIEKKAILLYETEEMLTDLWMSPHGILYATAEEGHIHRLKNQSWNVINTPEMDMLSAIWGLNDNVVYAIGNGVILYLENGNWIPVVSGYSGYFESIDGTSIDNIYVVGSDGVMVHFDGSTWNNLDTPTNLHLNSVHVLNNEQVIVVGAEGVLLVGAFNHWEIIQFDNIDFVDVIQANNRVFLAASEKGLYQIEGENVICIRDDIEVSRLKERNGKLYVSGGLSIHSFDGDVWERYDYKIL